MFPVWLSLKGRRCLVVGGGPVGLRKVVGLLDAEAQVTVVSPDVVPELDALARSGRLALERRPYRSGEAAEGFALVFAATSDRDVNRRVSDDAESANVFVNVADDPELCTFYLPGRVRRGPLEVALASGGEAPFLLRRLRQALDRKLGPQWAEWAECAGRFRTTVRQAGLPTAEQEACFDRFVAGTLDVERFDVRVPSPGEMREWLGHAEAPAAVGGTAADRPSDVAPGLVSLVGAGPGNAGLLTVRGRERTLAADAVVYDRLAAGALPADLPAHVELHGVGKEAGHHPVPQDQINELLVSLARSGKRVVRFKGGDPYVFGRGSEEAEALQGAGVPFEVVPGVTSGIAATALAGIPVTHRREAVQVTLLTAHECLKSGGPQVRWDLLAGDPHGTLVGYMGMSALASAVDRLIAAGMPPDTPAAVVQEGTTSSQRSVVATLATLVDTATDAGLEPPALFVIGPTVRHAETLNSSPHRLLTRERLALGADDLPLRLALEEAGAEVIPVPLSITPAARIILGARPLTGCVVRSAAEVETFDEECRGSGAGRAWTAWCLGRDAAARAAERGWPHVELSGDDPREIVARIAASRAGTRGA